MQNFSQIGEVPWPTLTQILQNMPLKCLFQEKNCNKLRIELEPLSHVNLKDRKQELAISQANLIHTPHFRAVAKNTL